MIAKQKMANFKIGVDQWDNFVTNCRKDKTDASKKLREYIENFNKNRSS